MKYRKTVFGTYFRYCFETPTRRSRIIHWSFLYQYWTFKSQISSPTGSSVFCLSALKIALPRFQMAYTEFFRFRTRKIISALSKNVQLINFDWFKEIVCFQTNWWRVCFYSNFIFCIFETEKFWTTCFFFISIFSTEETDIRNKNEIFHICRWELLCLQNLKYEEKSQIQKIICFISLLK